VVGGTSVSDSKTAVTEVRDNQRLGKGLEEDLQGGGHPRRLRRKRYGRRGQGDTEVRARWSVRMNGVIYFRSRGILSPIIITVPPKFVIRVEIFFGSRGRSNDRRQTRGRYQRTTTISRHSARSRRRSRSRRRTLRSRSRRGTLRLSRVTLGKLEI
jgi:hypothetical protein